MRTGEFRVRSILIIQVTALKTNDCCVEKPHNAGGKQVLWKSGSKWNTGCGNTLHVEDKNYFQFCDLNLNAMEVRLKQNTDNMGKFSSFLIYSRKNIKHSENIFHILRAIQNILHGFQQLSSSTDPLTQWCFTCTITKIKLTKKKTSRLVLHASLRDPPIGRQLLCGTAISDRAARKGFVVMSLFHSHSTADFWMGNKDSN